MKKRSKALLRKLKERKKRHHADSTSHDAPKPMQAMMSSKSGSGRSTIASPAASGGR
jgi:Flp pilus assembly CpaE family ATPase